MKKTDEERKNLIQGINSSNKKLIQNSIAELNAKGLEEEFFILSEDSLAEWHVNSLEKSDFKIERVNIDIDFNFRLSNLTVSSIHFSKCHFKKSIELIELNSTSSIQFSDCHFYRNLKIIRSKSTSISFTGNNFYNNDISIHDHNGETSLSFTMNAAANSISLKNFTLQSINFIENNALNADYKGRKGIFCNNVSLTQIEAKNLILNANLLVNKKINIQNCQFDKLSCSATATPTDNLILEMKIDNGKIIDLEIQNTNYKILLLSNFAAKKIDIKAKGENLIINNLNSLNKDESYVRLSGTYSSVKLSDLFFFKSIQFLEDFKSTRDTSIKNIKTTEIIFSKPSKETSYNSNLSLSTISNLNNKLYIFKQPVKLHFHRILFYGNLDLRNCILEENSFNGCEFNRNIDFNNVTFHIVPKLHNINFNDTCHINFVSCNFKDFGNIEAESSYRSLKNQSIKTNYDYGEHLFTALEIRSRLTKFKFYKIEKIMGMTAWVFNKFGESITRPFLWWLASFVIFSIICYQINAISIINTDKLPLTAYGGTWLDFLSTDNEARSKFLIISYNIKNFWSSINYSLINSIIIFKFTTVAKFLYPKYRCILFLGIFQSVLSSTLIYLFIIGIKKRFRQK